MMGAHEQRLLPLFVYGTLKPGEPNHAAYLDGRYVSVQSAVMRDATLFSDGCYPYLVIDSRVLQPGDSVHGTLVVLNSDQYQESLARIDWLEDYKPNSPWSMYDRVVVTVETAEGRVEAWAYVAGPQASTAIRAGRLVYIPGGTWSAHGDR